MRAPRRLYEASHIADGVKLVAKLQQRVLKEDPMSAGPLTALKPPPPAEAGAEPVELREAHCHACGEKKAFQVEGTDTMANGALRKYGKGACGHKVSTFVSGKEAATGV
jgi:hypothetical protein